MSALPRQQAFPTAVTPLACPQRVDSLLFRRRLVLATGDAAQHLTEQAHVLRARCLECRIRREWHFALGLAIPHPGVLACQQCRDPGVGADGAELRRPGRVYRECRVAEVGYALRAGRPAGGPLNVVALPCRVVRRGKCRDRVRGGVPVWRHETAPMGRWAISSAVLTTMAIAQAYSNREYRVTGRAG